MKISLQLKLGQQLTMTPQLQQAIRLLQLSTLDLQQEIQEALETNPMLEVEEEYSDNDSREHEKESAGDDGEGGKREESLELSADSPNTAEEPDSEPDFSSDESWNDNDIPEQLSVDSNWDDIYTNNSPSLPANPDADDFDFDSRNGSTESLQDYLNWQLNLTPMSDGDRLIAMAIIDSIDDNGQLSSSIESIHAGLIRELDIEEDEVLAVLRRIQQFDPVGVAYRDLKECLSLQMQQMPVETPGLVLAGRIVNEYLDALASHDYSLIMKRLKVKEPELKEALAIILSLNPQPGADIAPSDATYIVPDVMVYKDKGRWKIELNPDTAPRLRVNPDYAALVQRQNNANASDDSFLKDSLQEARWFIKSLQSRNETLLKVATRIVEHQKDFLEYGDEAMKPLVLHDIAEAVDMHESTISRVTTQKYMHTPRGIFELKYFFSSHVGTESGGECSSTAIRAIIKKLVAAENPQKPLSDSKITQLLGEQGINIARRTIAKYRESLSIAPSNERKRLV